jgi:phosphoribosylanthranilate isomerase
MFQIKICGISTPVDAEMAINAGADAIGLNFYSKSLRYVTVDQAKEILRVVPPEVTTVGVFVNESVECVAKTCEALKLKMVQLHGDEPPEYLAQLKSLPVIKAFRLQCRTSLQPVEGFLEKVGTLTRQVKNLSYVLLDAHVEGEYGGTGVSADWDCCAQYAGNCKNPPLILAGGLTPDNVSAAIRRVCPAAVDTASGVESSPRKKDPRLVAAFVENARAAFLSKGG